MDFQRRDRGLQGLGVLIEPELHGFELFNAFVQLFHIQRGRHPIGRIGHLRNIGQPTGRALDRLRRKALQKIKARNEFAKRIGHWVATVAHGCLQSEDRDTLTQATAACKNYFAGTKSPRAIAVANGLLVSL